MKPIDAAKQLPTHEFIKEARKRNHCALNKLATGHWLKEALTRLEIAQAVKLGYMDLARKIARARKYAADRCRRPAWTTADEQNAIRELVSMIESHMEGYDNAPDDA